MRLHVKLRVGLSCNEGAGTGGAQDWCASRILILPCGSPLPTSFRPTGGVLGAAESAEAAETHGRIL
jgi:hypothetical protein